jgi:hypothetical protein
MGEYARAPATPALPSFSANRDRLAGRLLELARLLSNPVNVPTVQAELNRLAQG